MQSLTDIPHVEQYVGLWAMDERAFQEALAHVRTPELLRVHMEAVAAQPVGNGQGYQITDRGVAVINLIGPMTKYGSSLSALGRGTVGVRRAVREAAADDDVSGIMLLIDSPGGSVAGTEDLAADVADAARRKQVTAYIEDMGASAAYWVASQAARVVANPSAMVGSIGTYMVVHDLSSLYAREGIKTHVIRAGQFKGAGVEGASVTTEDLTELQRVVTSINELFIGSVAKGRRMGSEQARGLADGRVWIGADAMKLGLVDGIESFQSAVASLERNYKGGRRLAAKSMETQTFSTNTITVGLPTPATLDEIRLFCPGADDSWILKQLGAKATVDQARSSWAEEQNRRLAEKDKALAESQAKTKELEAKPRKPGVPVLAEEKAKAEESIADPATEWREALEAKVKAGMSRGRATCVLARERPELREALVAAANRKSA